MEKGDIIFSLTRAADENSTVAEDPNDTVVRPKFRLQTEYVPEEGQVCLVSCCNYLLAKCEFIN